MKEVAGYLGNMPAVARASYVDPRLIDLFNDGVMISPALAVTDTDLSDGTTHGKIERAVVNLRGAEPDSELCHDCSASTTVRESTADSKLAMLRPMTILISAVQIWPFRLPSKEIGTTIAATVKERLSS